MAAFKVLLCFAGLLALAVAQDPPNMVLGERFAEGVAFTEDNGSDEQAPVCFDTPASFAGLGRFYYVAPIIKLPLPPIKCQDPVTFTGVVRVWIFNPSSTAWTLSIWCRFYDSWGNSVSVHVTITVSPGCFVRFQKRVSLTATYPRPGFTVIRLRVKVQEEGGLKRIFCDQACGRIGPCDNPVLPPEEIEGCAEEVPGEILAKETLFAQVKATILPPPGPQQMGVELTVKIWVHFSIWNPFKRDVDVSIVCRQTADGQEDGLQTKDLTIPAECWYHYWIHIEIKWRFFDPDVIIRTHDVVQTVEQEVTTQVGETGCDAHLFRLLPGGPS